MAVLSAFQSGPKGSKGSVMVRDVFDNLGLFWAHLDTSVPFQTKINLLPHKDKVGFGGGAFEQKLIFVWNCSKGSKRAQKGPKWSKTSRLTILDPFGPFWTPLDHFGMLTSLLCLAIFVYFIGAFFGMNATFNSFIPSLDVRKNECNFHHLSFFSLPNCCWPALVQS